MFLTKKLTPLSLTLLTGRFPLVGTTLRLLPAPSGLPQTATLLSPMLVRVVLVVVPALLSMVVLQGESP